MRFFIAFFVAFVIISVATGSSEIDIIPLKISGHTLSAEVAYTQLSRAQGLMYRESLAENTGMLFVFPEAGYHSMWMKDTYIPLSVAFIDEHGVILNIADMLPQTRTAHDSSGMAKYALEMNIGWFSARRIATGAQVTGLEQAPAAD
jgi:uncharacterized membrane protein (UPF0127 family)